ncbi:MAG: hypothetical protein D6731_05780 [Planctomycetota bacterium]|nr:MAG: hypothetical protein D6731_05780 [Planctomycetota bacterium]
MKLCLTLCDGDPAAVRAALPEGSFLAPRLVPPGFDPAVARLALLGQDPRSTWTGPAAWGLSCVRTDLAEDESAYLFTPVRVADGVVVEAPVRLASGRVLDLLEWFEEETPCDPVQVFAANPPLLVLGEPHVGPPALRPEPLVGRSLSDLPAGPPELLRRMIDMSELACLEVGGRATHFFPNSPGPPSRVQPLRETWLGLRRALVVGGSPVAYGLAHSLRIGHAPAAAGDELAAARAAAEGQELVVIVREEPPAELAAAFPDALALAVAGRPDAEGRVPLAWLSRAEQALDEGVDLLKPLALGRGQSGRYRRAP